MLEPFLLRPTTPGFPGPMPAPRVSSGPGPASPTPGTARPDKGREGGLCCSLGTLCASLPGGDGAKRGTALGCLCGQGRVRAAVLQEGLSEWDEDLLSTSPAGIRGIRSQPDARLFQIEFSCSPSPWPSDRRLSRPSSGLRGSRGTQLSWGFPAPGLHPLGQQRRGLPLLLKGRSRRTDRPRGARADSRSKGQALWAGREGPSPQGKRAPAGVDLGERRRAGGGGWAGGPAWGQRLTFLSRNDAIRPKFLGCCMNLWEQKGGREARPRGASQLGGHRAPGRLPSPRARPGGRRPTRSN